MASELGPGIGLHAPACRKNWRAANRHKPAISAKAAQLWIFPSVRMSASMAADYGTHSSWPALTAGSVSALADMIS
jgi:hypothetical protein